MDGYLTNDNGFRFYNPQTKEMLKSCDVIFMEDKFDVRKLDCTQENFDFFTDSAGIAENDNAECNTNAPENGNVEDQEVAIDKKAERPQQARRPSHRLNFLTSDWWNLIDAALTAIFATEEPTTIEEAALTQSYGERQLKVNTIHWNRTKLGWFGWFTRR